MTGELDTAWAMLDEIEERKLSDRLEAVSNGVDELIERLRVATETMRESFAATHEALNAIDRRLTEVEASNPHNG